MKLAFGLKNLILLGKRALHQAAKDIQGLNTIVAQLASQARLGYMCMSRGMCQSSRGREGVGRVVEVARRSYMSSQRTGDLWIATVGRRVAELKSAWFAITGQDKVNGPTL